MNSSRHPLDHDADVGAITAARLRAAGETPEARRVLIVNEDGVRFNVVRATLEGLGHEPIRGAASALDVPAMLEQLQPDVALVGRRGSASHALELVAAIVHEGCCPVILLLPERDAGYVRAGARRGAFACVGVLGPEEMQGALDIAVERFAQYRDLQAAFGGRAIIEQAKGILMARNRVDQEEAFELLRNHARSHSQKLVHVAEAVVTSHQLLLPEPGESAEPHELGQ